MVEPNHRITDKAKPIHAQRHGGIPFLGDEVFDETSDDDSGKGVGSVMALDRFYSRSSRSSEVKN